MRGFWSMVLHSASFAATGAAVVGCVPSFGVEPKPQPIPMKLMWFKAPSKVNPNIEFSVSVKYMTRSTCDDVEEAKAVVDEATQTVNLTGKVGYQQSVFGGPCSAGDSFKGTIFPVVVAKSGVYGIHATIYPGDSFGGYSHLSPPLFEFNSFEPYNVIQEIVSE